MSDNIKLVIEIPESDYKAICENKEDAIIAHDTCRRIAKNGMPLDDVLDKIRAEILQLDYDIDFVDFDYNDMPMTEEIHTICREEVLQILDNIGRK